LLYAGSYTALAALNFSFSAQIFGQWLSVPIALVLLADGARPSRRAWLLATILLAFGVFSHIGVAILGFGWMGVFVVLLLLGGARRELVWPALLGGALAALAFGLLYIEIAAITLSHLGTIAERDDTGPLPGLTPLFLRGLQLAYGEAGLALLPLGLLLFARGVRGRLALPYAWLLVALAFLGVDLLLGAQVRYFYFALSLVVALLGLFLGRLAQRGAAGRVAAWGLALAVAVPNLLLWLDKAFADGRISMTPLTH
jgi:hypothetical protein